MSFLKGGFVVTDKEINEARLKHDILTLKKRELEDLKNKINRLSKNPTVKKYLRLIEEFDNIKSCENEENNYFSSVALNTQESNQILVYTGIEIGKSGKDLYCYKDLETLKVYKINFKDINEFEKTRKVVNMPIDLLMENNWDFMKAFENFRNEFLGGLITDSQNKVVEAFVKKYNKKGKNK